MKIITFIDLENFRHSLWEHDKLREPYYDKIHNVCEHVIKVLNWEKYNPRLIRTYIYTGEYANTLITKIKSLQAYYSEDWQQKKLKECLDIAIKRRSAQQGVLKWISHSNFIEVRKTPLKFDLFGSKPIYQKGIDVLVATDLVSHAYQDNFDVAILCSGDLDLLGAINLIKNLGKKIIVFSHKKQVAPAIIKASDHFCDISKLKKESLDLFSEMRKPKPFDKKS